MPIQLSDHFNTRRLLRFAMPSIGTMIFLSIYTVVDGIFASNLTGPTPFAALNLVWPFIQILSGVGFIIGTGGSALVAYRLGQGKKELANRTFSLLILTIFLLSGTLTLLGEAFLPRVIRLMGSNEAMFPHALTYGRIMLIGLIPFTLQNAFQAFMVTAERPKMGLRITVAAGLTNIALDYLFMGPMHMGIGGAALGTVLSQCVGGFIPLVFFLLPNKTPLRIGKTRYDGPALRQTFWNGSSEFVTNIAMSLVSMLYNWQLMRYIGEDGVNAYGILIYVAFVFIAIFLGYSMGTGPIVSFHHGAKNAAELKNLFRKSLVFVGITAVTMVVLSQILAVPLAKIFVGYDEGLTKLTAHAFRIYSLSFLLSGFNIYGSDFFTALNNGKVSALISFLRTLVFETGCVLFLPHFLGVEGIWMSLPIAEAISLCVTAAFLIRNRHVYHYA